MKKISFIFLIIVLNYLAALAQNDPSIHDKFTPKFYNINGYNINVEVLGEGDPIVFLAGGPGNSHDYMQGTFGRYYKTNKVIFIDLLGRGLSDDAEDNSAYSVENDVETLEAIRKILKLEKYSLAGHSYGAVHAQAYAIKYPERVTRMVLISGFHSGEMWQANCDNYNHMAKTFFPELWQKVDSMRALGYVSSDPEFVELYGKFPTKYVYYHNTELGQNMPLEKVRSMSIDVYTTIIGRDGDFWVGGSMIEQDFRRKLKDLNFPTLIFAGRYDGVATPEYAIQYKKFMPQAKFVMCEQSGHNPYLEEPEKFFKIFDEFFGIE
ncbi:alpha/beta fold hydrolase [Bacteroidota bacterium]